MKNLPWIIGALAAIAFFGFWEWYAFDHPNRVNTLSHAIATLGATWPLSIFLMGQFTGVLCAHFFWPWKQNPLGDGEG